jgi:hypothetical protein
VFFFISPWSTFVLHALSIYAQFSSSLTLSDEIVCKGMKGKQRYQITQLQLELEMRDINNLTHQFTKQYHGNVQNTNLDLEQTCVREPLHTLIVIL